MNHKAGSARLESRCLRCGAEFKGMMWETRIWWREHNCHPKPLPSPPPVPFQGLDGPPEVDRPALEPLKGSDGPLGSGSESRGEDNWQCWRCGRMVHGDQPHCACLMEEIGE